MKPTLLAAALVAALLGLAVSGASAASVTTADALMQDARAYAAGTSRPSFRDFVRAYGRSVRLEGVMWDLTLNPATMAELAAIFGRSDPWYYRREAQPHYGRGGRGD